MAVTELKRLLNRASPCLLLLLRGQAFAHPAAAGFAAAGAPSGSRFFHQTRATRDGLIVDLTHNKNVLVVALANIGAEGPVVNSRLSVAGADPELTLTTTKQGVVFPLLNNGMAVPLLKEDYLELLPSRSPGAVYHDSVLRLAYNFAPGCCTVSKPDEATKSWRPWLAGSDRGDHDCVTKWAPL